MEAIEAMIHSLQANKDLRLTWNNLFERPITYSFGNRGKTVDRTPAPKEVRERFTRQLAQEQRRESYTLILSVLLAAVLFAALYFYGDILYALIVHQVGEA